MNRIVDVLEALRTDRRLSRHARTLARVYKRLRNDPESRNWVFYTIGDAVDGGDPASNFRIGLAVRPAGVSLPGYALAVGVVPLHGTDKHARVSRGVRYVIRRLASTTSEPSPHGPGPVNYVERAYPSTIPPIGLAHALLDACLEWREKRRTHCNNGMRASSSESSVASGLERPQSRQTSLSRIRRKGKRRLAHAYKGLAQEAVAPSIDWLESGFTSMHLVQVEAPSQESLDQYDNVIAEAIGKTRFLGAIEMPDDAVSSLIGLIAHRFADSSDHRTCAANLARTYPCAVAYMLVHVARSEYVEGKVWPAVARRLGGIELWHARLLGPSLEICRKRHSIAVCKTDRAQRYVTQMLFQGGIPDSYIPQFISYVNDRFVRRGYISPGTVVSELRKGPRRGYWFDRQLSASHGAIRRHGDYYHKVTKPIRDFLMHGGEWAELWVAVTASAVGSENGVPPHLAKVAPLRLMRVLQDSLMADIASAAATMDEQLAEEAPGGPHDSGGLHARARPRRAGAVEVRLDLDTLYPAIQIGELFLEGVFDGTAVVEAVVRGIGGRHPVCRKRLEARKTAGGAVTVPAAIPLASLDGPLSLDLEYGTCMLSSYPVTSMGNNDICFVFSQTGRLVHEDVLEGAAVWMLVRQGAEILPDAAVRMRDAVPGAIGHDLALLDLQRCESGEVTVSDGIRERRLGVRPELVDEDVILDGGERSEGAFCGGRPIFQGLLPKARFRSARGGSDCGVNLRELRLTIRTLDDGAIREVNLTEGFDAVDEREGAVDLNRLLETYAIENERPLKVSLDWPDRFGMRGRAAMVRLPGLIVDWGDPVLVPEHGKTALVDVIVPPGWELVPDAPARIRERFDEVCVIEFRSDVVAICGSLTSGGERLRIAFEPPAVRWRLEGSSDGQPRPCVAAEAWSSAARDIWLEDIDHLVCDTLSTMFSVPGVRAVRLEAGGVRQLQNVSPGTQVVRLSLGKLAEVARGQPPSIPVYLSLIGSGLSELAKLRVATIHSKWTPQSVDGALAEVPESRGRKAISVAWAGITPRVHMTVTIGPAWNQRGHAWQAQIKPGASGCSFDVGEATAGPYLMIIAPEEDSLWVRRPNSNTAPVDESTVCEVWVSDGRPQVRGLNVVKEGKKTHCHGTVHPEAACANLMGAALYDSQNGPHLVEVPIRVLGGGRFEFVIDVSERPPSIVGVCTRGLDPPYRFVAVGQCLCAMEYLTGDSAASWAARIKHLGEGIRVWIIPESSAPMMVPFVFRESVLTAIAGGQAESGFSLGLIGYPGAVKLVRGSGDSDFVLETQTTLVRCQNPNCPYPRDLIPQEEWDRKHYPGCKRCKSEYRVVKARLGIDYDLAHLAARTCPEGA
ncbi:MAG: hypothetical protein NUW23_01790, partial [Firmicutes bacterium]|nr:hypothetical protein [Bacillota bacterium]